MYSLNPYFQYLSIYADHSILVYIMLIQICLEVTQLMINMQQFNCLHFGCPKWGVGSFIRESEQHNPATCIGQLCPTQSCTCALQSFLQLLHEIAPKVFVTKICLQYFVSLSLTHTHTHNIVTHTTHINAIKVCAHTHFALFH